MLYLGLDVHSKWMTIKGMDPESGEIVCIDRVGCDRDSIARVFSGINGPLFGAMEAGTNSWSVYRILEPYFEKLLIVDPATVWGKEARRGAKTDRRDAMKLAEKLYRDELVGIYVPDENTQDRRCLVRAKVQATQMVTQITNQIGTVLKSWGVIVECSLLSKKGENLISQAKETLPEHSLMVLNLLLDMLAKAQETEAKFDAAIQKEAERDDECQLLMTIPGVGSFTALAVAAEIGDINRFSSAAQLIAYCGLCPSVHSSGGKTYYGKLSKACNRVLRYALLLRGGSVSRLRGDNPLKKTYWRVAFRNHANTAKVAVARQMVRVMHSMLKHKSEWDPSKLARAKSEPVTA